MLAAGAVIAIAGVMVMGTALGVCGMHCAAGDHGDRVCVGLAGQAGPGRRCAVPASVAVGRRIRRDWASVQLLALIFGFRGGIGGRHIRISWSRPHAIVSVNAR